MAASARLAVSEADTDAAILAGYREGLEAGGRPFVLAERWPGLWRLAMDRMDRPDKFWRRLEALTPVPARHVPPSALKALGALLPAGDLPLRYAHRVSGAGSLGRQRFVVLAEWCGGNIAREAKAVAPPTHAWSHRAEGETRDLYREILARAVRCRDPYVAARRRWIVRRLAPDCSRIDLSELPREKEVTSLLHAMGWETANVHLGSLPAAAILVDLLSRPAGWLREAVDEMLEAVHEDWEAWRKTGEA